MTRLTVHRADGSGVAAGPFTEERDIARELKGLGVRFERWRADRPLRVVLIGTDFQVSVWNALLKIPMGKALAYSEIAADIGRPDAPRAVGAAVGANPVSFVVPCHRAMGKSGALTGYHWGLTRKRAILGWEAGQLAGA